MWQKVKKRESELARERQRECVWVSFYMCWLDAKEVWVSSAFVRVLVLERERNRGRREGVDKWGRVGKSEMPSTLSRRSIRPIAFSVLIIFFLSCWMYGWTATVCDVRIIIDFKKVYYIFIEERMALPQHNTQSKRWNVLVCVFEICMWTRAKDFHSKVAKGTEESEEAVLCYQKSRKNRTMSNNKMREA